MCACNAYIYMYTQSLGSSMINKLGFRHTRKKERKVQYTSPLDLYCSVWWSIICFHGGWALKRKTSCWNNIAIFNNFVEKMYCTFYFPLSGAKFTYKSQKMCGYIHFTAQHTAHVYVCIFDSTLWNIQATYTAHSPQNVKIRSVMTQCFALPLLVSLHIKHPARPYRDHYISKHTHTHTNKHTHTHTSV